MDLLNNYHCPSHVARVVVLLIGSTIPNRNIYNSRIPLNRATTEQEKRTRNEKKEEIYKYDEIPKATVM